MPIIQMTKLSLGDVLFFSFNKYLLSRDGIPIQAAAFARQRCDLLLSCPDLDEILIMSSPLSKAQVPDV